MKHALHFLGVFFIVSGLVDIALSLVLRHREKNKP